VASSAEDLKKEHTSVSSSLEAFKEALRKEYFRRYRKEAREIEDRLADAIAQRRLEVEREVSRMRLAQKEALVLRKEEIRGKVLYELTEYLYSLGQKVSDAAREEFHLEIAALREEGSLEKVDRRLFEEALGCFGEEKVVLYCLPDFPEDLRRHPQVLASGILEDEDAWGGCMLVDGATRTLVVDNRLSTRWNKVRNRLAKEIGNTMEELFDQVLRATRELRLS